MYLLTDATKGSNYRMVVNSNGDIEQETHYYPYGGVIGDISTNENFLKYKLFHYIPREQARSEGKELDRTFGLDNYDIHARQYFAMAPMWDRIDPLAEKYYGISPYAYCGGDPVNKMDNTGLFPDSTRAVVAQQINEIINNTCFGSGSTGGVRKLEDSENYKARDENAYYIMNCEYNEDTGECVATDYINGDLSVISFGTARALKKGHDALGSLIKKYIPSNGYSSVNNEANKLLNIINSMSSVATGFIPEAIKEEKKK